MKAPLKFVAAAIYMATICISNASLILTSFSQITPSAGAIADDPALANRITNLMNVTIQTGRDWTNSEIRLTLTSGTVYNATNAVTTESNPITAFWGVPGFRNGEFDTFVNRRGVAAATLVAGLNADGSYHPLPADGLSGVNATVVSAAWVDTQAGEDGTFSIGRFTLSTNAMGTYFGRTFDSTGDVLSFSGTINGGVMSSVPEPTGILTGLLCLGLAAMRRRAR